MDARVVFRAQRLAREIYESELRRELVGLGYQVVSYRDGRHGRTANEWPRLERGGP